MSAVDQFPIPRAHEEGEEEYQQPAAALSAKRHSSGPMAVADRASEGSSGGLTSSPPKVCAGNLLVQLLVTVQL